VNYESDIRKRVDASRSGTLDTVVKASGTLGVLKLHRSTVFSFDSRGRMVHENDPRHSRGKRFSFTGCPEGNLSVVRDDVSEGAARTLLGFLQAATPFIQDDRPPAGLASCLVALGVDGAIEDGHFGLLWKLPAGLRYGVVAELVTSGTVQADRLVERFTEVVPDSLKERGFREPADLWAPWCVAIVGDQVASIAQTVRKRLDGAEVGVDTAKEVRGRGLAAAATAGWSRHPELQDSTLFYSTGRTNVASRRVTDRLGLELIAHTFAVP
jgi:hypothetical protein